METAPSAPPTSKFPLNLNPPLGIILMILACAAAFAVYLVCILQCMKAPARRAVPVEQSSESFDSLQIVSRNRKSIDMILFGRNNLDTVYLKKGADYFYKFQVRKKVKNIDTLVTDSLRIIPMSTGAIVFGDSTMKSSVNLSRTQLIFAENPRLLIWVQLIALLNAVSWMLGFYFLYLLYLQARKLSKADFWSVALILVILVFILLYFKLQDIDRWNSFVPLQYSDILKTFQFIFKPEQVERLFEWLTTPVEICGLLASANLLLLPFLSQNALNNTMQSEWKAQSDAQTEIKDLFVFLVIALSGLILFGLITNVLMYDVLANRIGSGFTLIMPREFSLAYGVKYSIILAIFYFPVYFFLNNNREILLKNLLNRGAPATEVNQALGNNGEWAKFWSRSKVIIAALTPLLGTASVELFNNIFDLFK